MKIWAKLLIILFFFTSFISSADKIPTIIDLVDELEDIFYHGEHTYIVTKSNNPYAMVRDYLLGTYDLDEKIIEKYEFVWWSKELIFDTRIAGTLKFGAALRAVTEGTEFMDIIEDDKNPKRRRRAQAIMRQLKKKKAVFGFDGFWQNGCAAPTQMLLILDKKNRCVHGIDLHPCRE